MKQINAVPDLGDSKVISQPVGEPEQTVTGGWRIADPVVLAGLILAGFGLMKLVALLRGTIDLPAPDPVLHIRTGSLLVVVAPIKMASGLVAMFMPRRLVGSVVLAISGLAFSVYRVIQMTSSAGAPCPCLAGAPGWLFLDQELQNCLLSTLAFYFLLVGLWGSCRSLIED